jgi:uncharacterized membrane protein YgcG
VAAGKRLGKADRASLERAVAQAETNTGLQFCVYLGPAKGDPKEHAEQLFQSARASSRPAVMLYVAPDVRQVECVIAPEATARLTDDAAQAGVDAMLPVLADGHLARGLATGLELLAAAAGPPRGDEPDEELPNIIG